MKIHGARLVLTVAVFAAGCTLLLHLVYAALFPPVTFYLSRRWTLWNAPMDEDRLGIEYMFTLVEGCLTSAHKSHQSEVLGKNQRQLRSTGFLCRKDIHTHICLSSTKVIIQARNNQELIIYQPSSANGLLSDLSIKPYARQEDSAAMAKVTPVHIFHGTDYNIPHCNVSHNVPAVVFSSGGFSGNLYHEFSEIIIPLFLTSHHFRKKVQFVITDLKPFLVKKYRTVFAHLSDYDLINSQDTKVHCFQGAVVGLKFHKNLGFNGTKIPKGYDMSQFRKFLRKSYSLKASKVSQVLTTRAKPVLLLISRRSTRMFLNEDKMVATMTSVGYKVIIADPNMTKNLEFFSKVVNQCSVILGAHGAGLTNLLFLPAGAVVVQVVPLGLDWASDAYFGEPVRDMDLRYVVYKIEPEESSLIDVYGRDHPVITDPMTVFAKGYEAARDTYVDGQNLKINLLRLKETLIHVQEILSNSEMSIR